MRVLVISDVHANLAALEAVLADAGDFEGCWCLGDTVGYGPDPMACLDRVRRISTLTVPGNHDLATTGALTLAAFNQPAAAAVRWTQSQVNAAEIAYLNALPETVITVDFTLVHGSPRLPVWEYLWDTEAARQCFAGLGASSYLVGHTHRPTVFELVQGVCVQFELRPGDVLELGQRRVIFNPGSVGQPRDGDPRASYAVYDNVRRTISLHRVGYDISETQVRMRSAGLPETLVKRLGEGH